jgi:hypothetical protein
VGNVSFRPAGGYGIAEDPPALAHGEMRNAYRTPAFNFPQGDQKLRRGDVFDRPFADGGGEGEKVMLVALTMPVPGGIAFSLAL